MDLIIKDRGHGKTFELVKKSAESGYRILTPYTHSSKHIQTIADDLGLIIPSPLEHRTLSLRQYHNFNEPVLIDELDTFIKQALGYKVIAATLSSEDTRILEGSEHFLVSRLNVGRVSSGYEFQFKPEKEKNTELGKNIKKVIYNAPATIVYWTDGSKTIVKCQPMDTYNPETGLAMCIIKKMCGDKGNYNDVFNKWLPKEKGEVIENKVQTTVDGVKNYYVDDIEFSKSEIEIMFLKKLIDSDIYAAVESVCKFMNVYYCENIINSIIISGISKSELIKQYLKNILCWVQYRKYRFKDSNKSK